MENGDGRGNGDGGDPRAQKPRRGTIYSLIVGMAFVGLIFVAGVNTISNGGGVLGSENETDLPLSQFAVPDARLGVQGDANIAQDNCDSARIPCPSGSRRIPACEVTVRGAIRVCDYFNRPLVLSFWFTRGGDCENQEDVFERAYRRFKDKVNFLAIDVRDGDSEVKKLIAQHHWTHPIGLDRDGGLSNLFRIGGCPTFIYAFPGGIVQSTSIGELDDADFDARVNRLLAATKQRDDTLR